MATDKSIQSLRKHLEVLWMTVMKIVAVTVVSYYGILLQGAAV